MPFFVDSTRSPDILRIVWSAWPTLDEMRVWRSTSVEAGILTPVTRALIDIRAVWTFPKFDAVANQTDAALRDGGLPLHRAYLAMPGLQYGVARQLQVLLGDGGIAIEVFTDEQAAENWLMAPL